MQKEYINDYGMITEAQKGDEKALEAIVNTNIGLVKSIAMRFCDRGVEFEDLVQIGTIGMIKAIRKFDTSYNTAFSTYAVPMIIGEIKRFLRDDGIIKVSRTAKKNAHTISKFREEFLASQGREPTIDEIVHTVGITSEEAVFALEAAQPVCSIYRESEDTPGIEDVVGNDDGIERLCESISLRESLSTLSEEDRKLIFLRYFKNLTQQQTAKILGYSQVKVSREEKRIFQKLRDLL